MIRAIRSPVLQHLSPRFWGPFVALGLVVVTVVFGLSLRGGLAQLDHTAAVRLSQTSDRLLGQLESYRELVNVLVAHPVVREGGPDLNEFLLDAALRSGADDVYITDASGRVSASSNAGTEASYIGADFSGRDDLVSARSGVLGFHHAITEADSARDFFYARGILDEARRPVGFVVIKVDVAGLEFEWRIDEDPVALFDASARAFVTNRPSLALRRLGLRDGPEAFYARRATRLFGHLIWRMPAAEVVPQTSLVRTQDIPQIDMRAFVFMDVAGVLRSAVLQAALATALLAVVGLGLGILAQRRALLAEANLLLEARVEARTQELRAAQNALVQASKLSALGEMSAGISHELNQPLATIRNYADNAQKLLERGRAEETARNLGEISAQVSRMDRIIRHLRGFARKEPEAFENIVLHEVVEAALAEARPRLSGVDLHLDVPIDLRVQAGRVRLQQVLGNLIANALDAMEGQADPRLSLRVYEEGEMAVLALRDTGPGLAEPDRVFEPFYTTKEVGASKGLGLGLSISYGIIGSFGGQLSAHDWAEAPAEDTGFGAEFRVALKRAEGGR